MERLGFRADSVSNGQQAIHALETIPYDIVFMDVQMPVMDGFEATRLIRSGATKAPDPRVPIIAMTAHAMKGDRQRCLDAGMDDYVPKPIAPDDLSRAIERWLVQGEERRPAGEPVAPAEVPAEVLPVFDHAAFLARLMGDEDLVKEISRDFLDDIPKQLALLREAVGRGDGPGASKLAHSIKGACGSVGAMAMAGAAAELEEAGKSGRPEAISGLLLEVERQFVGVRDRMGRLAEG